MSDKPAIIGKTTNFDTILAAYQDEGDVRMRALTPKQRELLERWEQASDMFQQYGMKDKVANMLMKRYGLKSKSTAYGYLRDAQRFFGMQSKFDKEYYREFLWNRGIQALDRAIIRKDSKAEASLIRELVRISGIDKIDSDLPDWKTLVVAQIHVHTDVEKLGIERQEDIEEAIVEFLEEKKKGQDDE